MLAFTPTDTTTKSADTSPPASVDTFNAPPSWATPVTLVEVSSVTPWASTQRFSISPPVASIILEIMRSSASTTVRLTPRSTKLSKIMQPINPAPINTTLAPFLARVAMYSASSKVQQWCTPSKSMPGTFGTKGVDPVATNSLS